jgi:hypothetical protein
VSCQADKIWFQLFAHLMIVFEIIFDEMIIFLVYIMFRSANICRIVYPQNSVGMLALSRFCMCAMSNGHDFVLWWHIGVLVFRGGTHI